MAGELPRASAATLESETAFRLSSVPMCVADEYTRIVATNAAFEARLGACRDCAIASLFVDPDERAGATAGLRRVFEQSPPVEFRGLCATSEKARVLSWSCRAIDRLILAVLEDATERVGAERDLAQKTAELDALLRALPDTYFRLDAQGKIVAWRAGHDLSFGGAADALVGRRPADVLPRDFTAPLASAVERVRRERTRITFESSIAGRDDRLETRVVLCGEHAITGVIRSLAAPRTAAEPLTQALEPSGASEKLEAIGRLARGVAHDFNNQLTVILGRLQFLRRAPTVTGDDRDNVDEAFEAATQAASIARQMVAFSRVQVMQSRVFSPNSVIASMGEMLGRLVGEHIEVIFFLDESAGLVESDPGQFEQVVLNLVLNAREAMPGGGTIIVSTREVTIRKGAPRSEAIPPGAYVALSVIDNGRGVGQEGTAHLFEPFFTLQGRGGRAAPSATLAGARSHAVVRSDPGIGSTFVLYLPRAGEDSPAEVRPADSSNESESRGTTVLVVEDEDGLRRLVVEVLKRAGYRVISADCGDQALRVLLAHGHPLSLLLSDVVMPKMSGRTLAARVLQICPDARVLLMSGHDEPELAGAPLPRRPLPTMRKPFTEETLLAQVDALLAGAGAGEVGRPAVG